MAIDQIRSKIERFSIPIVGVSNTFSSTGNSIKGRIIKIAFVCGNVAGAMISGNITITDGITGENIWTQSASAGVSFQSTNPVRYPRVSGHTAAGVLVANNYDDEIGFPCTSVSVSIAGLTPATGTGTCYIWFQ